MAAGFEHSVANMYFIPMGLMLKSRFPTLPDADAVTWGGFVGNLGPVILGNLLGGSVFVAIVYYLIYRRGTKAGGGKS